jgi:hypothetical protein
MITTLHQNFSLGFSPNCIITISSEVFTTQFFVLFVFHLITLFLNLK